MFALLNISKPSSELSPPDAIPLVTFQPHQSRTRISHPKDFGNCSLCFFGPPQLLEQPADSAYLIGPKSAGFVAVHSRKESCDVRTSDQQISTHPSRVFVGRRHLDLTKDQAMTTPNRCYPWTLVWFDRTAEIWSNPDCGSPGKGALLPSSSELSRRFLEQKKHRGLADRESLLHSTGSQKLDHDG